MEQIYKVCEQQQQKSDLKKRRVDLKTVITACVIITLCAITLIVVVIDAMPGMEELETSDTIVTLFTNACTAVITYYFTRRSRTSTHSDEPN